MTAVQTGPTSIRVTWTPSSPLPLGTGLTILVMPGDSDSVTVSGGSTDMRTLTGLQNGDTYTISIVATSDSGLPSESVAADMSVGLCESNLTLSPPITLTCMIYSSRPTSDQCGLHNSHLHHTLWRCSQ